MALILGPYSPLNIIFDALIHCDISFFSDLDELLVLNDQCLVGQGQEVVMAKMNSVKIGCDFNLVRFKNK